MVKTKKITVIKLNTKKRTIKKRTIKKRTIKNKSKSCNIYTKPKNFIFGYGSLINSYSRKYTGKGFIGNGIPVVLSKKTGYNRVWTCKKSNYGNYSFLGLIKDKKNALDINGIIMPVYKCIKNFDKREKGYKRIKIRYNPKIKNAFTALSWQKMPNYPCNIYIYTITDRLYNKPNKKCPISQNYLDTVLSGCLEYGNDFAIDFLKNTSNWCDKAGKMYCKNDRNKNKRCWIKNNNKKNKVKIDRLLKKVMPIIIKERY